MQSAEHADDAAMAMLTRARRPPKPEEGVTRLLETEHPADRDPRWSAVRDTQRIRLDDLTPSSRACFVRAHSISFGAVPHARIPTPHNSRRLR
jgi:hypothetical protein